jgi:hypothetical protein
VVGWRLRRPRPARRSRSDSDWTLGGGGGSPQFTNVVVAATPYRNSSEGSQQVQTYVFAQTVAVPSSVWADLRHGWILPEVESMVGLEQPNR